MGKTTMGMFDSIYPNNAWCPYCGVDMAGAEFQTKTGDCALHNYASWEEFGATIPTTGSFRAYAQCTNCQEWVDLNVPNMSKEFRDWQRKEFGTLKKINLLKNIIRKLSRYDR